MIWQGSEFYNKSFKKWLEYNNIEIYSTHNEGKFVAAERFIRTLKTKIYKHITSPSKMFVLINWMILWMNTIMYITQQLRWNQSMLNKDNTYIDFKREVNNKDSKFKVGDHARISKQTYFCLRICTKWGRRNF